MAKRIVTAERIIKAPPAKIFDLLADPAKHATFDGSGTLQQPSSSGSRRLALGDRFGMDLHNGMNYSVKNVVCEFEENRVIAWHHFARLVWRYELTEVEGGTKVVESFNYSAPLGLPLSFTSIPAKNQQNMVKTLERIAELVE